MQVNLHCIRDHHSIKGSRANHNQEPFDEYLHEVVPELPCRATHDTLQSGRFLRWSGVLVAPRSSGSQIEVQ
jgi:hypothetical protein